jgi:predicted small secreted protein
MKRLFQFGLSLTLLAALVLAACNNTSGGGKLKQTRDDPTFQVTLHIVPDNQITAKCAELGVEYEADGCNAFNLDKKTCDIYVSGQRWSGDTDRLAIMGHELWHCRFGKWHD